MRQPNGLMAGLILMVIAGISSGCLVSETRSIWFINPAAQVLWVVEESHVRSDAQALLDQRTEESEYWLAVQQDRHRMAMGFRELNGDRIRTVVLRSEAPFAVRTEARFSGLDVLGQRLIAGIGATGTSVLTRDGDTSDWTMVMRDPSAMGATGEPSDGVGALLDALEHLQVVLTTGRFTSADCFVLSRDGRIASFNTAELEKGDYPTIKLRLTWTVSK